MKVSTCMYVCMQEQHAGLLPYKHTSEAYAIAACTDSDTHSPSPAVDGVGEHLRLLEHPLAAHPLQRQHALRPLLQAVAEGPRAQCPML
jgi:hypothetical protein